MTRPRASDRIGSREAFSDPEVLAWCECVIALWRGDPALQLEFISIVDLYDFGHEVAEVLIRSATKF